MNATNSPCILLYIIYRAKSLELELLPTLKPQRQHFEHSLPKKWVSIRIVKQRLFSNIAATDNPLCQEVKINEKTHANSIPNKIS